MEIVLDEQETECETIKEEERELQTYYRGHRYERKPKRDKAKEMLDNGRVEVLSKMLSDLIHHEA